MIPRGHRRESMKTDRTKPTALRRDDAKLVNVDAET
jgi:hypothetical protein